MSAASFAEAGAVLAEAAVMPSLRILTSGGLEHEKVAHVYAGLLGAILGYMAADLGPDDAEALFHGFDGAFDEARAMQAASAARGH